MNSKSESCCQPRKSLSQIQKRVKQFFYRIIVETDCDTHDRKSDTDNTETGKMSPRICPNSHNSLQTFLSSTSGSHSVQQFNTPFGIPSSSEIYLLMGTMTWVTKFPLS